MKDFPVLEIGDKVIIKHRSFNDRFSKTKVVRKTPTGQIIVGVQNMRFKYGGTRYKCVSGENAQLMLFSQELWDSISAQQEHERLKANIYNTLPKFVRNATVEQLRRIEAIMTETIRSAKHE